MSELVVSSNVNAPVAVLDAKDLKELRRLKAREEAINKLAEWVLEKRAAHEERMQEFRDRIWQKYGLQEGCEYGICQANGEIRLLAKRPQIQEL